MALWTGLGQAAAVAQLVGADVGGLISIITQAALTARQNRKECEQVARRVLMIAELLPHLAAYPEAVRPLAGLGDTLREAHELVVSCQGRGLAYQFAMAGRQADKFRDVQARIDSYLILFPMISHIGITRRLDRIYNILVPDSAATSSPSPPPSSPQLLQFVPREPAEVAPEVVPPHGTEEFTLAEMLAATNNFASGNKIGSGGSGKVYRGTLPDGREVAIKRGAHRRISYPLMEEFRTEFAILSQLRHKSIIRLLGWCIGKGKRKRVERLFVYEYMENGTLYDLLHRQQPPSASPLTLSWKMRIDVLLSVSRATEHLHCHAVPPVIHRDIKSANILFDSSWVPRLTDFGQSVNWDTTNEDHIHVIGTIGYIDPEYLQTARLKPASDVYNLGVLMLEVLTGKNAILNTEDVGEKPPLDLPCFALPIIAAGGLEELLDKRPAPEPTPRQLQALEHVAHTAACCLQMQGEDRPAISEVVASLEKALDFMCSHDTPVDALLCTRPKMWDYRRPLQNSYTSDDDDESVPVPVLEPEGVLSDTELTEPR